MLKGKIKDRSDRRVWAAYRDGFQLEIRHTPRAHSQSIADRAKKEEWDNAIGAYAPSIDKEKYYQLIAAEVIMDWRGLTPEVLRTLVDMESYPDAEVPYSQEDAAELLAKVQGLDVWVQTLARNLDHYEQQRRAAEIKNS